MSEPWRPSPPKAKVYRFGASWLWKCKGPRCQHGGRERVWGEAVNRATGHLADHVEEGTNGWV